ncbi:hypothetical protein K1X76_00555 [bacterium]|nr:hypothetical protein [bacterium]
MKQILFITPSILAANLLLAVTSLLKSEVELTVLHSLDALEGNQFKKVHLVLADQRVFLPNQNTEKQKEILFNHPKLTRSRFFLIHDNPQNFDTKGFATCLLKPFLPNDLARAIEKGLKG